jgi:hypothetical protein
LKEPVGLGIGHEHGMDTAEGTAVIVGNQVGGVEHGAVAAQPAPDADRFPASVWVRDHDKVSPVTASIAVTSRRDFLRRATGVAVGAAVVGAVGSRAATSFASVPGRNAGAVVPASDGSNLVVNGGFEDTDGQGGATGWSFVS